MTPFEIVEAASLREAVTLLDPEDMSIRPIAGGTALMLMMKAGVFQPMRLISLRGVEKRASGVQIGADGGVRIGALSTLAALERSSDLKLVLPVIDRTLRELSNVRVRNVATVGGNLAHGDPHMDLPPVLIALDASVTVLGPDGERIVPVAELLTGYYETQLATNELISEIVIPPQNGKRSVYLKCTTRAAHDWPALGVAIAIAGDRDRIAEANVVISAATEKATRLDKASALLVGQPPSAKLLRDVADAAATEVELTGDVRGSAPYKQQLVRVYVERALRQALEMDGSAVQ
jgi:carbon-monoxide dehydrogenase medium subunit